MSLGRSPCDSLVLKDDKSSVKVDDFNDPSMCLYAVILNQLRSVTRVILASGSSKILVSMAHHAAFGSDMGAAIFYYRLHGGVRL